MIQVPPIFFFPHAFHDISKNLLPSESSPQFIPFFSFFNILIVAFSSVRFSLSVVSEALWPHGLQHARLPCPSLTLKAYSDSHLSSQWCHPTISSSVVPFSSCLQSFPASGSFPVSQFFASGGQSIVAFALIFRSLMHFADIIFTLNVTGTLHELLYLILTKMLRGHLSSFSISVLQTMQCDLESLRAAVPFTIAKTCKQPKCPLIEEWMKIWYIYTVEYCCC